MPIGVFDSGLGGLTVLKALQTQLPNESLIYYGDTAHLPYGDKSPATVRGYVAKIVAWLVAQPVKLIVVACNTASAVGIDRIREVAGPVPVVEVVGPAVAAALATAPRGHIGVIATKTTIGSQIYPRHLHQLSPEVQVVAKATPLLVPMIEEGVGLQTQIADQVIAYYLDDPAFEAVDVLVLGCTHYPLIRSRIERYLAGKGRSPVRVIDAAEPTAATVAGVLAERQLATPSTQPGRVRFVVSDRGEPFVQSATLFFGQPIELEEVKFES